MPLFATLIDDFSATLDTTVKWLGTYGGPFTANGILNVPCGTSTAGAVCQQIYTLTGSGICAQLVAPPGMASGTGGYTEMIISSTTGGTDIQFTCFESGLSLTVRVGYSSAADTRAVFLAFDPVLHAWWRVRLQAGTLYWEASPNGQAWAVLRAEASPPAFTANTNLQVLFNAGRTSGTADNAQWDNVGIPLPYPSIQPLGPRRRASNF